MKAEFARNLTGYILLALGIAAIASGELRHLAETAKTGGLLVSAALLAFQAKRTSDRDPAADNNKANPTQPAA